MKAETKIQVFVKPNASRNSIEGWAGDEIQIRICAPPEKNKANQELIRFLSKKLRIPQKDIKITSGIRSKHKQITVSNILEIDILEILK